MFRLWLYELKSRWKAMLGWSIGLILFGALYISIFPEVEDEMASLADLSIYQVMGMSLGSFEDFMASIVLLFLPLLLGIYAIMTSTKAIAGEEDAGTLELLIARPIGRVQIVIAKAAAICVSLAVILVCTGAGSAAVLAAVNESAGTTLPPMQLFTALMAGWPLAFAFAMIALFLGAFLPTRRIASMTAAVIFIASYFGENISGMVSSLEPLKPFSLFSYYDSSAAIFSNGADLADVLILIAVGGVFLALAVLSFQRRNVTVGAWPWVKNKGPRTAERLEPGAV